MGIISLKNVSISYGAQDILQNVSISLQTGKRAALTGGNGSGKTTLMKILAGIVSPDLGTVTVSKGMTVSYLPQALIFESQKTLYEEAQSAFDSYVKLLNRKQHIETLLAELGSGKQPHTDTSPGIDSLLHELDDIQEHLIHSGYYDKDIYIEKVLAGLGFSRSDFTKGCTAFSGGWKMRIVLAKILLESPDFLLLDEPTNYLDIDARMWLTGFLSAYHGGVLLVSHDKQFLDSTVSHIFHILSGAVTPFTGTYSQFEVHQQEEREKLIKAYHEQQEEIARIEQFISRFRYKDSKSAQVQSRIKYLEKMEKIELPSYLKKMHFSFPPPPHSGRKVMELQEVSKSYGSEPVLDSISFLIERGDRIAVTGRNGAGKTTLMRILAGRDQEYSGEVSLGTGVRIGYFQQDIDSALRGDQSIYEELEHSAPFELQPKLRNYLGAFLFSDDDIYKSLNVLSGGEKSRVQLLKLLMQPYNVLILDEPTNHLDITSKEVLLEALKDFSGTIIFVSHDLFFIKELTNRIVYLDNRAFTVYEGDYDYFVWKLTHEESAPESAEIFPPDQHIPEGSRRSLLSGSGHAAGFTEKRNAKRAEKKSAEDTGDAYARQKQLRNRYQKAVQREKEVLAEIEKSEKTVSDIQHSMAEPEIYSSSEKITALQDELHAEESRIADLTEEWELLSGEIAELEEITS